MNRALVLAGVLLVLVGLLWKPLSRVPLFRLPGDFVISVVVSLILWWFRR